eukprot:CAMPEP_0183580384 /NCGR_PEP_ID=MMETSP0371-20130417/145566_1 /TAXON_ID=268820 /ORGANISM="Peridinium aciculiferum, Strain PAER-2" /LENGTH=65 /DNA_ID=CAMNT_0025790953 /DNA_START=45 /DNA_END=242 /DNA_ORIENTATION=-
MAISPSAVAIVHVGVLCSLVLVFFELQQHREMHAPIFDLGRRADGLPEAIMDFQRQRNAISGVAL